MRRLALVMALALLGTVLTAGVALALPEGPRGVVVPGQTADGWIWFYSSDPTAGSPSSTSGSVDTLGGAISSGFYGNTSNSGVDVDAPDSGHGVTASLAPGPSKGGCAGVVPGASLGFFITGKGPAAVGRAYDPC